MIRSMKTPALNPRSLPKAPRLHSIGNAAGQLHCSPGTILELLEANGLSVALYLNGIAYIDDVTLDRLHEIVFDARNTKHAITS